MTYASLAALKEAVGMSGSSSDAIDDGVLNSTLVRASAKVDSWLTLHRHGYHGIAGSSNSRNAVGSNTYLFDGTGDDTLFIGDFASVSSVTVSGTVVDSASYSLWPYNDAVKRAIIYNQPISYPMRGLMAGHWWPGTANVSVVGFAGLANVPDDVVQATIAVALIYWRRYQSGDERPAVQRSMGVEGVIGYIVDDPEVEGILASALQGWYMPGVHGA